MSEKKEPLKIGLALAGGGTYAIFQVGVIEAIKNKEKSGFIMDKKVKAISGTSGGAINSVFLGFDNMDITRLKNFWEENNVECFLKNASVFLETHFKRLRNMENIEIEYNDVDEIPLAYSNQIIDFVTSNLFSLGRHFNFDSEELGAQMYSGVKLYESISSLFFPFLKDVQNIPKRIAQKLMRIFLRELLAKHFLPEEKVSKKTACYSRIKHGIDGQGFPKISIFIGATNILKSSDNFFTSIATDNAKYLEKFKGSRYRYAISIESILACSAVPEVFPAKRLYSYPLYQALGFNKETGEISLKKDFDFKGHWGNFKDTEEEIDGKEEGAYWDGYFISNPSLEPLIRVGCVEILLIRLASVENDNIPEHHDDIENRKEILIQNVTTETEIQSIRLRNEFVEQNLKHLQDEAASKFIRVHEIRFSKDNIIDQVINDPAQSDAYINMGNIAGEFFKNSYNKLNELIEKYEIDMDPAHAEIVVNCHYEKKNIELMIRDCVNDISYHVTGYKCAF